jgi:dsDNA-specific endonuclease/ATPase MutS2
MINLQAVLHYLLSLCPVVEANNELRGLMLDEQREIEKIPYQINHEEVQSSNESHINNLKVTCYP